MQLLIVGAGAVGTYVGAFLAHSGQLVTLVARSEFVQAVNAAENALTIQSPSGPGWQTRNFRAVACAEAAAESQGLFGPPYDAILLCMKAYDLQGAISELQPRTEQLCHPTASPELQTTFLCFQNGVGSEDEAAQAFGADRVWAATTTSPVSVIKPGCVRVERAHGTVCLAPCQSATGSRRSTSPVRQQSLLVQAFRGALFNFQFTADGRALKWSKLLLNILGNATSAILGLSPAEIYSNHKLFHLEMQALREAVRVMNALRVHPTNLPSYPARTLAAAAQTLPEVLLQPIMCAQLTRGRGTKWPSLYYDVQKSTGHSEVGWLNGAVVRYGRQYGIPTPANQRLTEVLTRIARGDDDARSWQGQVEKLTHY
jgi:2-dehydropantoate 2-reductase